MSAFSIKVHLGQFMDLPLKRIEIGMLNGISILAMCGIILTITVTE